MILIIILIILAGCLFFACSKGKESTDQECKEREMRYSLPYGRGKGDWQASGSNDIDAPPGWRSLRDPSGRIFFISEVTGVRVWHIPPPRQYPMRLNPSVRGAPHQRMPMYNNRML